MNCSNDSEDLASEELIAEITSVEDADSRLISDVLWFKLLTSISSAVSVALSEGLDGDLHTSHQINYIAINCNHKT